MKLNLISLKLLPPLSLAMVVGVSTPLWADDWSAARPDGHAPISVMAEHTHHEGKWMVSYRYMYMDMDGMWNGKTEASASDVFAANYTVTPERMTMQMHMLGAMYGLTEKVTLMAMAPWTTSEMSHSILPGSPLIGANGGSSTFTTKADGIGDLRVGGMYQFLHQGPRASHAGLALSIPTGSISESDVIPVPMVGRQERQLPAAMQPGSGTWDIIPSITYLEQYDLWSWGAQAHGVIRTDNNDHGYKLGDVAEATAWAAWKTTRWMSLAGRAAYRWQGELIGSQSNVGTAAPMGRLTVPTAFGFNYGGQQVSVGGGVNFMAPGGTLKGWRAAVDAMVPVWRDLNGYQLGVDYSLTAGLQYAW